VIINTKLKMYRFLKKGLFGNTSKIYESLSEMPNNIPMSMRYNRPGNIKRCNPGITKKEIIKNKINFNDITVCEQPELKGKCVLNAELMINHKGLNLRYKVGNMWMRPAMKNPDRAIGLKAKFILEKYLNSSDYDTIMDLLNIYPDHIIEFTVFDHYVGTIPNRNTIIWEVRRY